FVKFQVLRYPQKTFSYPFPFYKHLLCLIWLKTWEACIDLFIWQKKRASAITDALFLQCFYALFWSIFFSLKSDPFASDSVSFTNVSSIVLSNLLKFLLAKSLPPRPNAKPNAKASTLNVIKNAEIKIVLAIPSCVSDINTARTIIAYLANPANTFVAGPSSK